jgi:hypothetical protein
MNRVQIQRLKHGPSGQLLDGTSEWHGPMAGVIIFPASSRSRKRSGGLKSKHRRGCRSVAAHPMHLVVLRPHNRSTSCAKGCDARDRACWQAVDQGCPGVDHRCRTAGAGRMIAVGPASCARTPSMRILRRRAIPARPGLGRISGAAQGRRRRSAPRRTNVTPWASSSRSHKGRPACRNRVYRATPRPLRLQ